MLNFFPFEQKVTEHKKLNGVSYKKKNKKKHKKTSYINLCFISFTNFIATSLAFNGVFTIEMTPLPLFLELRLFVTMIVFKYKNGNLVNMLFV